MNTISLEQIHFEAFAAAVKSVFRVETAENQALDLELSEVTAPRYSAQGGNSGSKHESFALLFTGPANPLLSQQMYWFESSTIGRFELFITPIGRDANGARYEAAFNRLVK